MRFASLRLRNVPPAAISTPKLKLAILLVAAVLGLTNAATLTPPATHVAGSSQTWGELRQSPGNDVQRNPPAYSVK